MSIVSSVAYSPDGKFLASASIDTTIKIWEVASGKVLSTLQGHLSIVSSVAYSPDGKFFASASSNKTINIWNCKNSLPLVEYLAIAKFQRMEVVFSAPTIDNLYGMQGRSFFVYPHSALGILRSGLPEAEKNYRLAWLYLQGGYWESVLLLWQQLPEGEEKNRLKIHLGLDVCNLDEADC